MSTITVAATTITRGEMVKTLDDIIDICSSDDADQRLNGVEWH